MFRVDRLDKDELLIFGHRNQRDMETKIAFEGRGMRAGNIQSSPMIGFYIRVTRAKGGDER